MSDMMKIEDMAIYELLHPEDHKKRKRAKKKKKDNAAKYGGMDFPMSGSAKGRTKELHMGGKIMYGYKEGGKV